MSTAADPPLDGPYDPDATNANSDHVLSHPDYRMKP